MKVETKKIIHLELIGPEEKIKQAEIEIKKVLEKYCKINITKTIPSEHDIAIIM